MSYDLQFCCSSKLANRIGIKIRSWSDWLNGLFPDSLIIMYFRIPVILAVQLTLQCMYAFNICMKNWGYSTLRNNKTSAIVCVIPTHNSWYMWFKLTQGLGKFSVYKWQAFHGLFPAYVSSNVNILWHLTWFSGSHYLTVWILRLSAQCCFISDNW